MREVLGSIPRIALLKHVVALQQALIQLSDVVLQSLRSWNDPRNSEHGQTSNSVLCSVCKSSNHVGQDEICQVWQTMLIEPSAIIKESSWCPARIMLRRLIQTNLKRDLSENLVGEGQHHVSARSPVAQ